MDRQWLTPSEYNNDEYEGTTTIDYLYSYEDNYGNDACFKLSFVKNQNEEGVIKYSVEATITKEGENFGVDTDLMYDSLIIWEEETGEVASFVESVIDYYVNNEEDQEDDVDEYEPEDKKELQKPDTVLNVEAPTTEDDRIIVGHKKPEVIDDKTGKRIIDELVVYISNDTKSVSLLDKFEGYGENQPAYRRIVVRNTKYAWALGLKNEAGINLVIERSRSHDYVGDITFTEFKQDKDYDLRNFLRNEITDAVAEKYLNKDEFYRFSKPYHLRAQNSSNRTGYGWEWDWSGGYGDYTEGTLYGETTDYVFVGAYITSRWNMYEPEDRQRFSGQQYIEVTTDKNIPVRLALYKGKLPRDMNQKAMQRYIKVQTNGGRTKYVPVSYNEGAGIVYILNDFYVKYKNQLQSQIVLVKSLNE